jgi:hypothetical protein
MDVSRYYDKEGKLISMMEWAKLQNDKDYSIIEQEYVGIYWVSTVYLGLDHNFYGGRQPLIFETMVFRGRESDFDMERYSTESQAVEGHRRMVNKWAKRQPNLLRRLALFLQDVDANLQRKRMLREWREKHESARHR